MNWLDIFNDPGLGTVGVGDDVVINVVNHTHHLVLFPVRKVIKATGAYLWTDDGMKWKRNGAPSPKPRKSNRTSSWLYAMTDERREYLRRRKQAKKEK
jgi:hypothetical protein